MSSYPEHLDLNSLNEEDGDLTEDDEVFTRGGKPFGEENGVSKPLMAPRQQQHGSNTGARGGRSDLLHTRVRRVPPIRVIWAPLMYALVALGAVIGIIVLIVFVINIFLEHLRLGNSQPLRGRVKSGEAQSRVHDPGPPPKGCSNISTEDVWSRTFPMLTTESALRLVDVNSDGVLDVILGFGTGADAYKYPEIVCNVYFSSSTGCGGGVLALDGRTGLELWRLYTTHEMFALNCNLDIDVDGVKDCIAGGRMAGLVAVSGRSGRLLWSLGDQQQQEEGVDALVSTSNFYTPLTIRDLDNDSIPDLVVIHGGDPLKEPSSRSRLVGRILMVSSQSGDILQWVQVPDKRESYYSPQMLVHPDGTELILFGTGGETHGGALWCIDLISLLLGNINQAKPIYSDPYKGVMTPPVLVDITGDGVTDIVMAMFNSTVIAFNGLTFEQLWNTRFPSSESYSTPGVGFFNKDAIPDFIVNYQTGPGFPIYYYTQTTILDGSSGRPLLSQPVRMVVGTQSSPLVVGVEGLGNDIFLYWVSDCHGDHTNKDLQFGFVPGTSVHEQSRSDFCKSRFKELLYARMYAMNRETDVPGTLVYDSDARKSQEYGKQLNYTAIGLRYLDNHPDILQNYNSFVGRGTDTQTRYDGHNIQGGMRRYPAGTELRNGPDTQDTWRRKGYYRNYKDYQGDSQDEDPGNVPQQQQDVPSWSGDGYWIPPSLQQQDQNPYAQGYVRQGGGQKRGEQAYRRENPWERKEFRYSKRSRLKRHVGPHDDGGIQRTISTGTLAPPFVKEEKDASMDVVFATFWFYPAKTQAILPEDTRCIQNRMATQEERFQITSLYYGMDIDQYKREITMECLKKTGHYTSGLDTDSSAYNPFDLQMGQMTVYRIRLHCLCTPGPEVKCGRIIPFEKQGWTGYMGNQGSSLYLPHQ